MVTKGNKEIKGQIGVAASPEQKLMVSGQVCLKDGQKSPVEVWRGMPIQTKDGAIGGKVAALLLNEEDEVTHLLLSHLPEKSCYWCIAVELIAGVNENAVKLSIPQASIESLPRWHGSSQCL